MLLDNSSVQKSQLIKEFDADFGCFFPTGIRSFIITVGTKCSNFMEQLQFLVLIPKEEQSKVIIKDIMNIFFDKGDRYASRYIRDDEIENLETNKYKFPILSYDPHTLLNDKISFFWLVPPLYLRQ